MSYYMKSKNMCEKCLKNMMTYLTNLKTTTITSPTVKFCFEKSNKIPIIIFFKLLSVKNINSTNSKTLF